MTMIIQEPDPKTRIVHDFEITFVNSHVVNFTIDKEAGDSMEIDGPLGTIVVNVVSKPSPDGTFMFPEETLTLTRNHIVSIKRTERSVTEQTLAQKEFWKLTLQEMASRTVQ